jgi:hypothetical protein
MDRSRLIKTPIIDKNGKGTTVYRAADSNGKKGRIKEVVLRASGDINPQDYVRDTQFLAVSMLGEKVKEVTGSERKVISTLFEQNSADGIKSADREHYSAAVELDVDASEMMAQYVHDTRRNPISRALLDSNSTRAVVDAHFEDCALALATRHLVPNDDFPEITWDRYDKMTREYRTVIGKLHDDDSEVAGIWAETPTPIETLREMATSHPQEANGVYGMEQAAERLHKVEAQNAADFDEETARIERMPRDEKGRIRIGEFSHLFLNQQTQYLARYVGSYSRGVHNEPDLTAGLDVTAGDTSYHDVQFAPEDVLEFTHRVREFRAVYLSRT